MTARRFLSWPARLLDWAGAGFLFAALCSIAAAADLSPAVPDIPARQFHLQDYGPTPANGIACTSLFQRAIAAVDQAGGGTLEIPAGEYLVGPLELCSSLNLHLERGARIKFLDDFSLYRESGEDYHPLMLARSCHDVMVSGEGVLDGNGEAWWQAQNKMWADAKARHDKIRPDLERPHLLVFRSCHRVRVEGITITRSPMFHCVPTDCEDVSIVGITITAPQDSPNTDGIDPSGCRRTLIKGCTIDNGDDGVALKAGAKGGAVEDLLVTDCTFVHGHGCSIGSLTVAGMRRITFQHCRFDSTGAGVRLKSNRFRGGVVEDVTYSDLEMIHVAVPISIDSYYPFPLGRGLPNIPEPGHPTAPAPVTPTTAIWRRITVRNIVATDSVTSAGVIMGLPEMPIQDVLLENISIDAPIGLRIGYAKKIRLRNVRIRAADAKPLVVDDTAEVEQLSGDLSK